MAKRPPKGSSQSIEIFEDDRLTTAMAAAT